MTCVVLKRIRLETITYVVCGCHALLALQFFNSNENPTLRYPQLIWQLQTLIFVHFRVPVSEIPPKNTRVIKHLIWPIRKRTTSFLQQSFLNDWVKADFTHKDRLALATIPTANMLNQAISSETKALRSTAMLPVSDKTGSSKETLSATIYACWFSTFFCLDYYRILYFLLPVSHDWYTIELCRSRGITL